MKALLVSLGLLVAVLPAAGLEPEASGRTGDGEMSVSMRVKFDALPSAGSATEGALDVRADGEGRLVVTVRAKPLELAGDYVFRSVRAVKPGAWTRFAFTYSRLRLRATLHLDGTLDWESDADYLPETAAGEVRASGAGGVSSGDLKVYDFALPPDELIPSGDGALSVAAARRARERAEIAKTLDAGVAAAPKGRNTDELAVLVAHPFTQQPILPTTLPDDADAAGPMRVFAAPDQCEGGSVVVFARKGPAKVVVRTDDLRAADGTVFPKRLVDAKLVKRWYRAGGAWLTYHSDVTMRILTPDLLLNDDAAVKVDELRRRNYLRLDYPGGTVYTDVSDATGSCQGWTDTVPFHDAAALQPVTIPEACRNQQFIFTFEVPRGTKPGLYRGTFDVSGARLPVELAVLPIDLPVQGSPKDAPDRSYFSLHNRLPEMKSGTLADRTAFYRSILRESRKHSINHLSAAWCSPALVPLAREAGLVPDRVDHLFSSVVKSDEPFPNWRDFYPGVAEESLTPALRTAAERASRRILWSCEAYAAKYLPDRKMLTDCVYSESGTYSRICTDQATREPLMRAAGMTISTHLMNKDLFLYDVDLVGVGVQVANDRDSARIRHAAGAEIMNYADPFPSTENPGAIRRVVGPYLYSIGYDGHMMHGFSGRRSVYNEFAFDAGDDGAYRNFSMAYPRHGGLIYKLAYEGMREAYDDVRYLTALRHLAMRHRESGNAFLRREAKRDLAWTEALDMKTVDLDYLRLSTAERIITLNRLAKKED